MKITIKLIMAALVLVFVACEKQEMYQPDDSELKAVNGRSNPWGDNCFRPIDCLTIEEHPPIIDSRRYSAASTTVFKGAIWSVTKANGTTVISRSKNGTEWEITATISTANYAISYPILIVFRNKLWLAGQEPPVGPSGGIQLFSSTDGHRWRHARNTPLRSFTGLFVFQDKLYILYYDRMYYTVDGHRWVQLNYPFDHHEGVRQAPRRMVVFKDHIYVFIDGIGVNNTDYPLDIWKSADGLNWSRVYPRYPYLLPNNGFSVSNYKGKLWVIGGFYRPSQQDYNIWYSEDAVNWEKFTGNSPIEAVIGHSATVFKDKIWLFGGTLDYSSVSPTYTISHN